MDYIVIPFSEVNQTRLLRIGGDCANAAEQRCTKERPLMLISRNKAISTYVITFPLCTFYWCKYIDRLTILISGFI